MAPQLIPHLAPLSTRSVNNKCYIPHQCWVLLLQNVTCLLLVQLVTKKADRYVGSEVFNWQPIIIIIFFFLSMSFINTLTHLLIYLFTHCFILVRVGSNYFFCPHSDSAFCQKP